MSVADAMNPNNLLCYEMNGAATRRRAWRADYGCSLPGWYGVANVKWLDRIEVIDTRFAGHFMARDYVTIREEQRDGQPVWVETAGRQGAAQVRAGPGDPQGRRLPDHRRSLGRPVASVEVQVDGGPWMPATITEGMRLRLRLEVLVAGLAGSPTPGEHTITSRATDTAGNVQPAMTDPHRQQADVLGEQRPDHAAGPNRLTADGSLDPAGGSHLGIGPHAAARPGLPGRGLPAVRGAGGGGHHGPRSGASRPRALRRGVNRVSR